MFDCGTQLRRCRRTSKEDGFLRQLRGESWTAAEVVMDDALVQDDGNMILDELDRCWEVTHDQDKTSMIEKALYATLRDAKLTESSYDKVVMWTGGSYVYDDVVRALVRLDRPEIRSGTSGPSGKSVPTYIIDPEEDAPTIVPSSEAWTQPSLDRLQ